VGDPVSVWERVKEMVRERDLRRGIRQSDHHDRVPAMADTIECACRRCLDCLLRPLRFHDGEGDTVAEKAYRRGWNDALRNAIEQLKKSGVDPLAVEAKT
jgi:hypothetical protein